MKINKPFGFLLAIVVTALVVVTVLADSSIQGVPFTSKSGGIGTNCPGEFTGYARMTNSAGAFWITPPTNAVNGTLTDLSGFPPPYVSVAYVVRRSDLTSWCDTNSVAFPATNSSSYELWVYVKNAPPPPTNGQPMNLQIVWQTNASGS